MGAGVMKYLQYIMYKSKDTYKDSLLMMCGKIIDRSVKDIEKLIYDYN